MLAKVLRQFETRKTEAGVDIAVRTQFEGGAGTALADPTLTAQIMYNLISNAIKYSPRGSKVEVVVASGVYATGKSGLTITVSDKGPGISPEYHERIFEKFYRVKDDYVYKVKGHGLGLYLSRFFADQMGARITIKSAPDEGASFTLHLPLAPQNNEVES
jgi:signal transduction histidine kinase